MRRFLTEEGEKLLRRQIDLASKELERISSIPPGTGLYRMQQRYIHGLEFLLEKEYEDV